MDSAAACTRLARRWLARRLRLATVGATCAAALLAGVGTLVWSAPSPQPSAFDGDLGLEVVQLPVSNPRAVPAQLRALYEAHAVPGISIKPYWGLAVTATGGYSVQPADVDLTESPHLPCKQVDERQARAAVTEEAQDTREDWTQDLRAYGDTLAQGLLWIAHALDVSRLSPSAL